MNSDHPLYRVAREMARAEDDTIGLSRIENMLNEAERQGYALLPTQEVAAMALALTEMLRVHSGERVSPSEISNAYMSGIDALRVLTTREPRRTFYGKSLKELVDGLSRTGHTEGPIGEKT